MATHLACEICGQSTDRHSDTCPANPRNRLEADSLARWADERAAGQRRSAEHIRECMADPEVCHPLVHNEKEASERDREADRFEAVARFFGEGQPAPPGGYDPEAWAEWLSNVSAGGECDVRIPASSMAPLVTTLNGGSRLQRCRACGCTDLDCSQCIDRTGAPCFWVPELEDEAGPICSACVTPEPELAHA